MLRATKEVGLAAESKSLMQRTISKFVTGAEKGMKLYPLKAALKNDNLFSVVISCVDAAPERGRRYPPRNSAHESAANAAADDLALDARMASIQKELGVLALEREAAASGPNTVALQA